MTSLTIALNYEDERGLTPDYLGTARPAAACVPQTLPLPFSQML